MPDIHWGYGFCIGGVAATDPAEGGVISPGGVGYDINCGVRLVRTNLHDDEVRPKMQPLMDALYRDIPAGVGEGGPYLFDRKELRRLMAEGVAYLATRGWATPGDHRTHRGRRLLRGADPDCVSDRAIDRGGDQCGTLGSGNHFLEVQVVDKSSTSRPPRDGPRKRPDLRDDPFRLARPGISSLRRRPDVAAQAPEKYGIELPDRQLACARSTAPRASSILGPCAGRRTTPGPIGSC